MNEHRQYDTDGCCICPSIDGHSYCYECGCPDPRPGIKATCGCTCQCHEQEHPMTQTSIRYVPEQNLYCLTWRTPIMPASSFWYFATHEEAEMAQAAMLQHEQRDSVVTTATVPERAPAGMLAVRVGSNPWTMVPLDDETDAPCALHGDAECDWGCPHPYSN